MLPIPIQEMCMPVCRPLGECSEKSGWVGGEGTGYSLLALSLFIITMVISSTAYELLSCDGLLVSLVGHGAEENPQPLNITFMIHT